MELKKIVVRRCGRTHWLGIGLPVRELHHKDGNHFNNEVG